SGDTDGDGELDVTETWIYEASYVITQDDIDAGEVVNQATTVGTAPDQSSVSAISGTDIGNEDPTIIELCQDPSIALIKVGTLIDENDDGCAGVDETILYTFSVKNTGNVTLSNITVTDPMVNVVGGPIDLGAGDEDVSTFTALYTVTQDDVDAGLIENQAFTEGISPNGTLVSDESDNANYLDDNPTVTDLCQNPSIGLEKSGVFNDDNDNGASDIGETISYSFAVTNTGDVTLYNITIEDLLPGIEMSGGPIEVLLPGETDSTTITGTYTITDGDIIKGQVENFATVTGEDYFGITVNDDSEAIVILPDPLSFEIFNGITPNGDGMNDYFWIRGIHRYPNNNVKIFNRWGVLVYETNGYGKGEDDSQNTFTGVSEGRVTVQEDKNLPTGTYFYVLTFQGENPGKDTYTGYLYINR
uniref:DUF7507 domain-containing protein n=1 Tax=Aequorivita marina TaxID=3073654 RepID=UPI0028747B1C